MHMDGFVHLQPRRSKGVMYAVDGLVQPPASNAM